MEHDSSKYSMYSIRGLPAGVWGESYAVVTAFESGSRELTTEYFVLTKRPKEALHSAAFKIAVTSLPPNSEPSTSSSLCRKVCVRLSYC